jgi:2'-5' RNA ligase
MVITRQKKSIFLVSRFRDAGARRVTYTQMHQTLRKIREAAQPRIPANAAEFGNTITAHDTLGKTLDGGDFFLRVVGEESAVFVARNAMAALARSQRLCADATFSVTPRPFRQTFTIHCLIRRNDGEEHVRTL